MEKSVTIVGMGLTSTDYFNLARRMDGEGPLKGEVWGINLMGALLCCDRIIMMDQAGPTWKEAFPEVILKRFLEPGCPIYTAKASDEFPRSVEFPMKEILPSIRYLYFNNSVAYALAMAIHEEFTHINLYGCDFSYPDPSMVQIIERGRACVEFWISQALARDIVVSMSSQTTLMDTYNRQFLYGYDMYPAELVQKLKESTNETLFDYVERSDESSSRHEHCDGSEPAGGHRHDAEPGEHRPSN